LDDFIQGGFYNPFGISYMTSNSDPRSASQSHKSLSVLNEPQQQTTGTIPVDSWHGSQLRSPVGNPLPSNDPLQTAQGVYVTIHGHFYQPPRENPYLDSIERQPSAAPFHDWNERIYHECYRPNAFARILNERGDVIEIINNYEFLSFNIGPTLMSWLERHDIETYQRILEADRKSCARLNGHGNAIAQLTTTLFCHWRTNVTN
jgi:hypothetical protein